MLDNLLEVKNLRICFNLPEGVMEAVKGVSFNIKSGETLALVGESGSGKSVISQAIMGILPKLAEITDGQILLTDRANKNNKIDIAALHTDSKEMRHIRGGKISIIFQEPMTSLSPLHTIGNQIIETVKLHRNVNNKQALELATEMLNMVGFPNPARAINSYPFELSGGLRQRAMIAMALVCRPSLLIADEPTTALDVTIQLQILKLINDLKCELNMAVLMITHDLSVVANMAQNILVMYNGEVMESGCLNDIFHDPQHPYLKALLKAVPRFNMKEGERLIPIREIIPKTGNLLALDNGKNIKINQAKPILIVENLYKTFTIKKNMFFKSKSDEIIAVKNISFSLKRGKCLGLVGESGCGKTTLSKILMRAISPDSGNITYNDGDDSYDLLKMNRSQLTSFRKKMQFIFQDPFSSLNPRMNVLDIITEPLIIHKIGNRNQQVTMAKELMELIGLDPRYLNRYPHSFSGGQRQRIGIARALSLRPQLLICDEPVSALDVSIQAQVLNLLKDLQKKLGLTYLFISHNLAVIDYIADDIAVMCRGRIVEYAPRQELFKNPTHPYTKGLLAAVPEPNPDHPLDFAHLMEEKSSNPDQWPAPFTDRPNHQLAMINLGKQHFVNAYINAKYEEIIA